MQYGGTSQGSYGGKGQILVAPTVVSPSFTGAIRGSDNVVLVNGIPFVLAPTGTMANNGAVTLGTALDRIYAKCFMYFPAGAIATSVPAAAAWLYTEMSSTTVGIVYNNTYTSGQPVLPSKTAFATTGPGAFTGVTGAVTAVNFTLGANLMGTQGRLESSSENVFNNSAGAKTNSITFGGTTYATNLSTTATGVTLEQAVCNAGETARQEGTSRAIASSASMAITLATTSNVDTTAGVAVAHVMNRGTATDFMAMNNCRHVIYSNVA